MPVAQIKRGSNFRRRTSIFLILFAITLGLSGYFVIQTQSKLDLSSERIREVLVPMRRLVQMANSDLRLQIQELKLITQLTREENISVENLAMIRLGPNVAALQNLQQGYWVPSSLRTLLESWKQETQNYTDQISIGSKISLSLTQLGEIQRTTEFLDRAVEREISVQLLAISEDTTHYLTLWGVFFAVGIVWMLLYFIFVWRWTLPLQELQEWIARDKSPVDWAPRSLKSRGLFSGASDFAELVDAIRARILKFQEASAALDEQASKNRETQRAITLLFTSLQVTIKKNEELVAELVQKEKLASMGEMAAQLAHEIRNPLNSLSLKLEILMEDVPAEQRALVEKMTGEIDRLNALTESHLRSTKSRILESSDADIREVVVSIRELMLEELSLKSCPLVIEEAHAGDDRRRATVAAIPPNVLKAVLLNLAKNSLQAQEQTPGVREIKVRYGVTEGGESFYLDVFDRGSGFPAEYQVAPFKIFQTTKKDGSGLGLSTSKSMLEAYGGLIQIITPEAPYASCVRVIGPLAPTDAKSTETSNEL
ncbi:MAG TPA: histidine kinase dimerization/phospho-acceptor domain-containing protein [Bdellovibrionota bacterium]|nr:histidine kinase dimerization/phospho-acceptor domain-containing protein [Bdellovibrionota bacterium]